MYFTRIVFFYKEIDAPTINFHLFMIEPVEFYANEQTAYTNHYQKAVSDEAADKIAEKPFKLNFIFKKCN
ncbi:MAG: hypothetical protein Ct9H90mP22_5850 [Gammaproteobacteria bacterium]|nr:MAG: hypothetical protein Ct9H90mP22_5850 [Gammaproteobacteria bacterium]